jgi:hypothetical protein
MTRKPLPTRRPSITRQVFWGQHELTVTIGIRPEDGAAAEVFVNSAKGGDMQAALADGSVLISVALQHGIAPAALAKSLGRVPVPGGPKGATQPASPVGAILEAIIAEVPQ